MVTVGVLALQGDFLEHINVLEMQNAECRMQNCEVRTFDELKDCTHLIIPGGESTVISKLLWESGLAEEIQRRFAEESLRVFGTCAGAIICAKEVNDERVKPLGLIDIEIERNAYGRQVESFSVSLSVKDVDHPVEASFIRAPKISRVGSGISVLAGHEGDPVLVREGGCIVSTFHTETSNDPTVHSLFLS